MTEPYTYGVWVVRPGEEDEFVARWQEMAEWAEAEAPGAGAALLLQDEAHPNRFVSLGAWASRDLLDRWRASDGFRRRASGLHELLESFAPADLRLRVETTPGGTTTGRPVAPAATAKS